MTDTCDEVAYHGRRSVEELVRAREAASVAGAKAHRDLSLLHLMRFVSTMNAAAETIAAD